MGKGHTGSHEGNRPLATTSAARSAVMWVGWTVAIAAVVTIGLVVVPAVVVWCLLFDAD